MNISVSINANKPVENVSVKVYGIYASRNRIELSKTIKLEPGNNIVEFDFRTPSCNRCSGISPGNYSITAEAEYSGTTIKETKQIEIQQ
jgi:hypothetical protein